MPDLGTQIGVARQSGYTDQQITAYLSSDPNYGPKVAQAKAAGYSDKEIADHLATSAPAPKENVFQKAGRLAAQYAGEASDAFKADVQAANAKHGEDLVADAKPVLDAFNGTVGALTRGVANATFGDKPVHLPASVAGVQVPQALQDVNSKGLTGGDIATFGLGGLGEVTKGVQAARAASELGVSARTAEQTLAASKAPASVVTPAKPNPLAEKVQAFDQVRVRPSLAAMGEGNARTAKAIAENPLAGGPARANLQASLDDAAQAADRAANSYGTPAARGAAGEAVQQGIQDFNQRFSQRASALYDKAFSKIDAAHAQAAADAQQQYAAAKVQAADDYENAKAAGQVDFRNRQAQAAYQQEQASRDAQQAASLRASKEGSARTAPPPEAPAQYVWPPEAPPQLPTPVKAPVIQPDATIGVLNEINARGDAPALKKLFLTPQVRTLTAATTRDLSSLSFDDLRNARTWVRNAQRDPTLRQGISQSDLQRLEGALTQDINSNAGRIAGPQVARQLQQADQFYRLGSQRIQGALQKFVGRSGDASGESAYDLIQRMASDKGGADSQRLLALKNSLKPSEWGDVAASTINRMAQGKDGTFSVNTFVTNMDNLSPQGKALLFGNGEQRAALDNLVKVARMQKGVEQAANHSNTASVAQSIGMVAGLVNPHTTLPTLAGLAGMAVSGDILTNPRAVRWLANLGRAEKTSPAAVSSALGRLKAEAARNAALLPVYAEASRAFGTPALPAAATPTSPAQSTPAPNN